MPVANGGQAASLAFGSIQTLTSSRAGSFRFFRRPSTKASRYSFAASCRPAACAERATSIRYQQSQNAPRSS